MSAANQFPAGSDPAALVIAGENDDLIAEAANESVAQTVRETAFAAASEGMRLFPLRSGQKFPPPEGWQALATTDADTISGWLTPLTSASDLLSDAPPNIGVLCGNGLVVLDLDPRNGSDESFTALEAKYGKLPRTRTATTPSGGTHYYFKVPVDREIRNDNRGKVGAGIDIKSNGGYVVLPGSSTEKGSYSWIDPTAPIAELPAQLLELVTQPRAPKTEVNTGATTAETPKHDLNVADAQEMLKYLDPNCDYEQWFEICVAMSRMAKGSQSGEPRVEWFNVLDDWSRQSPKYPGRSGVKEKWDQADTRASGFGLKHLSEMAKVGGYNPPPRLADPSVFPPVTSDVGMPPTPITHLLITDFMNQPEPSWLVDSVLMTDSILAVVYGEPGSGKSTIVLEMLLAIARGAKWHGREVEQGAVAYLAAESVVGLRKRLRAYEFVNNIQRNDLRDRFFPMPSGLNLSDPEDVENLIKYLKTLPTPHRLRVLAIDTLSQVTPGVNENTSEMNVPLSACKRIHAETGAIILPIAHCGKDQARGIRGWSGILGALDTEIEVSWDRDSDVRSVAIRKQRDGECNFPLFDCTLERIAYGQDSKNRELSSVVVKEVPQQEIPNSAPRRAIHAALADALRPLSLKDLVKTAKEKLDPPLANQKDRRAERIKATYRRMIDDKTLTVQSGLISISIPFGLVTESANLDLVGGAT
jgi:hypothetical protein